MVLQSSGTALRPFDPSTGSGTAGSGTAGSGDALYAYCSRDRCSYGRRLAARGNDHLLTVWLIKKADIVRKMDFYKDKSLFLCQCQLLIVHLYPILDWRVVVLSSELLDSVLERPTSSTLLLYTFVTPA